MFLVFTSSQPFLQDFPKDSMGAEQRHVDWPGAVEGRLPKRSPAGSPVLSLKESWGFMGIHGIWVYHEDKFDKFNKN